MLFEFPIIECKKSELIDKIYVSTDSEIIKKSLNKYKTDFIERPKKLNDSRALGEDVFKYVADEIVLRNEKKIEFFVLLLQIAQLLLPKCWTKPLEN